MSNNLLTVDWITREALKVLHQKLNFVTNIITDYDGSYFNQGAKKGNSIRVRLPMMFNTGTGATIATGTGADSLQNQVTFTLNTQRHVPMRFTSNEATMSREMFRRDYLTPAMSRLAAKIESDALSMVAKVPTAIAAGTKVEFADILAGNVKQQNHLAPDNDRYALLDPQANADLVDGLKGLFHDGEQVEKQYKEGVMGRNAGMDYYINTMMPAQTYGAEGGLSNYLVDGASQSGSYTSPNSQNLKVKTGTKTIKKGDVFTIASVNEVHPETKEDLGYARQFTFLENATGAGTYSVSPAMIPDGPYQNVTAVAANSATLTFAGAASTAYKQSLLFQKGFACFGTADLVLPPNTKSSRQVYDGISLRVIMDYYDGIKDLLYTRIDCLYGFQILRPDLACRIQHT